MHNHHNPFNMFGHTYTTQQPNQTPHYSSNQQPPQYTKPPNYPSTNMNYPSNNNTHQQYSGSNQIMRNQLDSGRQPNNQKHQQPLNNGKGIENYDTAINIENLSPKQLLCECIDLATTMLKEVVDAYVANNELKSPYEGRKVIDFSVLANYILDPTRLDNILTQFLAQDDQSVKALVKSWVFELKYIRNLWAHSEKVNYRLAFRGYDTLGLLFDSFGGEQNSELYRKIETYRKALLVAQVKSGIF